jgi:hypothetical protein
MPDFPTARLFDAQGHDLGTTPVPPGDHDGIVVTTPTNTRVFVRAVGARGAFVEIRVVSADLPRQEAPR